MISIEEKKSKKCPGETSLFLTFPFNQEIISIIKFAGDCIWDKVTKTWELPCNKLSYLIDNLATLDSIDINLLEDKKEHKLNITENFNTKPYQYQLEGIDYMLNNPNCMLLDDMGLGKTLQIIYLAEELKARGECEHCLIICGINSLKTNWEKEIAKHSKYDSVIIGKKINSKGKVSYKSVKERAEQLFNPIDEFFVILNVESIRDNAVVDAINNSKNKFDLIAIDETHKIGNPSSSQGKNLLKLRTVGKRHVCMTGTLLVNRPTDAYLPLKFIGKENASFTNFKNFYCLYESTFGHLSIIGYKNIDILKDEIDSCSLRRTKYILDLPPKIIVPEYIEMDSAQTKFYENIQSGVVEEADRVNIKTTSLLGLVTRLRQASTCPQVLTSLDVHSAKIDRACELVEDIVSNGEKVVIFSSFKEPLNILYDKLKKFNPVLGTGDLDDQLVSENVDKFQTDVNYKVFLGTTQKMGTGITLTAASYEIFIDSAWTASLEEQAEARCHRIGSNNPVTIYKLICSNTIDERVQNILNRKKMISDYMIDDKVSDVEELKELLGI